MKILSLNLVLSNAIIPPQSQEITPFISVKWQNSSLFADIISTHFFSPKNQRKIFSRTIKWRQKGRSGQKEVSLANSLKLLSPIWATAKHEGGKKWLMLKSCRTNLKGSNHAAQITTKIAFSSHWQLPCCLAPSNLLLDKASGSWRVSRDSHNNIK